MDWIVVVAIGAVIGLIVSFIMIEGLRMPQSLTVGLAVIGAVLGGLIDKVTGFMAFGQWTFYICATAVSIAILAGGILGYSLTKEEKRI